MIQNLRERLLDQIIKFSKKLSSKSKSKIETEFSFLNDSSQRGRGSSLKKLNSKKQNFKITIGKPQK